MTGRSRDQIALSVLRGKGIVMVIAKLSRQPLRSIEEEKRRMSVRVRMRTERKGNRRKEQYGNALAVNLSHIELDILEFMNEPFSSPRCFYFRPAAE